MSTRARLAPALIVTLALAGCAGPSSSGSSSTAGQTVASSPSAGEGAGAAPSSNAAAVAESRPSLTRPFAATSPWNTRVDQTPVDPRSRRLIALAQQDVEYVDGATPHVVTRTITSGLFINTTRWADTIAENSGGVATSIVCRQEIAYCGDGAHVSTLDIPANVSPMPQYDGWLTVMDPSAGVAYDLWRARRGGDGRVISYQYMRKWSLSGPGYAPPGIASARGSGLPLFAGMITPGDIRSGNIEHALAISLPSPARGRYVPPASTTDGVGPEQSLPEGARIRLRAGVRLGRLSAGEDAPAARAIARALELYGAIVVDRARVPTLYAQLNYPWQTPLRNSRGRLIYGNGRELSAALQGTQGQGVPLLRGNEVQSLRLSDFEVVSLPAEISYPAPEAGALPATSQVQG